MTRFFLSVNDSMQAMAQLSYRKRSWTIIGLACCEGKIKVTVVYYLYVVYYL